MPPKRKASSSSRPTSIQPTRRSLRNGPDQSLLDTPPPMASNMISSPPTAAKGTTVPRKASASASSRTSGPDQSLLDTPPPMASSAASRLQTPSLDSSIDSDNVIGKRRFGAGSITKKKKKPRRISTAARSIYLRFFVMCATDSAKRTCIICGTHVRYIYGKRIVSSSLKSHLVNHPIQLSLLESSDVRHSQAKKLLIQFISTGSASFSLAENPEFRSFVAALDPLFVVPSRRTLSTTLLDAEYAEVTNFIDSRIRCQDVTMTFDHWSSRNNNHTLMGCTAHVLSPDWERDLLVISLEEISGAHNSDQVASYLADLTDRYGIGSIVCTVTDNASVMRSGARKADVERIGCILHCMHLFVVESLAQWPPASPIISTIRRLAQHFHRSKPSWDQLKEQLELARCPCTRKLPLETRTRWGSMLRMLHVADIQVLLFHAMLYIFKFYVDILSPVSADLGFGDLSDGDKMILKRLVAFLSAIDESCAYWSTNYATLSAILPHLNGLRESFTDMSNTALETFVPVLIANFTKRFEGYYSNQLVMKSLLLDPRYLYWDILPDSDKEATLDDLFKEVQDTGSTSIEARPPPAKVVRLSLSSRVAPKAARPVSSGAAEEYDRLIALARQSAVPENIDPALFWKAHGRKFPLLSPLARKYLAIPPSSIDSERLFSCVGLISNNTLRARISGAVMTKQVLVSGHCRRMRLRYKSTEEWEEYHSEPSYLEDDIVTLPIPNDL